MAEKEQEEIETTEEKKSGSNMVLIIIIALLVLMLVGGAVAAFLLLSDSEEEDVSTTNASEKQQNVKRGRKSSKRSTDLLTIGPMYPMDQFIVNLLSESGRRFLKVSLDLELSSEELSLEIDSKKSLIRDIIIRTLSAKTFEEVSTMKGKDKLKDEIVDKINEVLADGNINNIFFTDFVVQ